ncbi:MAG: ABC transporter permease [Cyanobacteria bacterium]|nr:ABC transporter permease [Cyanobacteriota bacterium]
MWRYRLRSTLVVSCAALGVAGVIASINYASGGRQQVVNQIQRMGTNIIVVRAEQSRTTAGRARTGSIVTTLREPDYLALRRDLEGHVRSSAVVTAALRLKAGEFSKVSPVIGCEPAYFTMKSWNVERGTAFDSDDVRRAGRVALLGYSVAVDLYGTESPIGERLFINRVPFEVIGVLTERGQGLDAANEDAQVYVPLTTAMRRLLNVDHFNALVFEIRDWNEMDRSARDMIEILRVRHRTSLTRPADFQVQNQKELVDTQLASSERLAFLVRWIGLSGLLVSGLGVLAIAWIAVRDRTVEIGTRRALGATSTDIFFQFAFEASVSAACGSIAGLALGWSTSRVAAASAGLPFVFESISAAVALGSALAVNLAFASWPALKAARLDPIRAIAHE